MYFAVLVMYICMYVHMYIDNTYIRLIAVSAVPGRLTTDDVEQRLYSSLKGAQS
jgi:hypothetical protein